MYASVLDVMWNYLLVPLGHVVMILYILNHKSIRNKHLNLFVTKFSIKCNTVMLITNVSKYFSEIKMFLYLTSYTMYHNLLVRKMYLIHI